MTPRMIGLGMAHLICNDWLSGVFLGRGDLALQGAKIGNKRVFAAPKAPRKIFPYLFRSLKIFEHFLKIFGKFVNENAIENDFWGVVGRYILKI